MVIIISVPLTLTLLLSNRVVQNYAIDKATAVISNTLGTTIDIGSITYKMPASISLEKVYLEDQSKDTLAYIGDLSARLGMRALFNGHIAIKDVNIDSIFCHIKTDSTGQTNIQFIIDALADTSSTEPPVLTFEAPEVHLRNSRVKFDNISIAEQTDNRFDPAHIDIRDINIDASLAYASADSVNATLDKLNFREKSGLTLSDLTCQFIMSPTGMSIEGFTLKMPESQLNIPVAEIKYDSIAQFSELDKLVANGTVRMEIQQSEFYGNDFAGLLPELKKLRYPVTLRTSLGYQNGSLDLKLLNIDYGVNTGVNLRSKVTNILEAIPTKDTFLVDKLHFIADITRIGTNRADIENTLSDLTGKPFRLPKEISGFSTIQYKGNINGSIEKAKYTGRITTNAGDIITNADFGYSKKHKSVALNGNIKINEFDLSRLLDKSLGLGKLTFNLDANGSYYINEDRLAATANGVIKSFEYNNYTYKNIQLDGLFNPEKAIANISFIDENGNGALHVHGLYDNTGKEKYATALVDIDSLKLGQMGLVEKYPTLEISTELNSEINFTSVDDIHGYAYIDSIAIKNQRLTYIIDSLHTEAHIDNDGNKHVTVSSPLINGQIDGQCTPSNFFNNIFYVIAKDLNNIKPLSEVKKSGSSNNLDFNFTIQPLTDLAYLFDINASIDDTTFISGAFNDSIDDIDVKIFSNNLALGNNSIDSLSVYVDTYGEKTNLQVEGFFKTPLDTTYVSILSGIYQNTFNLEYSFWNTVEEDFSGSIKLDAEFFKPKHADADIEVLCTLEESEVIISDSLWTIKEGTIFFDEHTLKVDNISFEGTNAYLKIKGQADKDERGQIIAVDLKGIDLKYLSNVFYMPEIKLLGIASGKVVVGSAFQKDPILDADVEVLGFGLNDYRVADAHGKAKFNTENKHIELYAEVLNENRDTSYLNGYVAPFDNEMLLDIDINELHLGFIEPYLASFSHEMDGIASGKLYIGGPLDKVELWGDAYIHDAKLGIDYLKSTFHFSDSVHIKKDMFLFKNITITDNNGNKGIIDGEVTHKYFKNFKFKIGFEINNVLVLNTTAADFPDFYGTIRASGKAHILGDESQVNMSIAAKPEAGSYFAVPLDSYRNATDNQFITFIRKDTIRHTSADERRKHRFIDTPPTTKLNIDIAIEATPDVEARIILDSHTGDIIRALGNGNIKVTVDQNANVKIYGKYNIVEGDYNFSLQGAIRKKFEVDENSSIYFDGDPMNGQMNINAKYQTTASLADLFDQSVSSDLKTSNVKVNCLAKIQGNFLEPHITFDLDLPDSDAEMTRRVKAVVNTDDMMVQQMVFLLVFGKFYNSQLASTANTGSYASSFATATISSQLNYWMSQISNNVNFGLNYSDSNKDANNNYSVAVNVSTNLFNNRLVLYGNVGYSKQYGTNRIIGDFDAEYKLTKSGRFRLKAYNKTNDMLYSTSLYTQGVGVMYKETFDTWENLGKTYKELLRKKTPEEKEEIQKQKQADKEERAKIKEARKALREDRKRRHKEYVAEQKKLRAQRKAEKKAQKEAAKADK